MVFELRFEYEMRCEAHCSSSAFETNHRYYRIWFENRNIMSVEFLLVFKPVFCFPDLHRIRWRVFEKYYDDDITKIITMKTLWRFIIFLSTSTFHWSINYLHDSLSIVSCIHSCFTYEHKEWRLTFLSVFVLIISQLIFFKIVFLELNLWENPWYYEWFDEK